MHLTLRILMALIPLCALFTGCGRTQESTPAAGTVHAIEEGFVDANGVLLYYRMFGSGKPLVILHGGPGASHEYFLPYLLPLARKHRLVFVDERGSGRSEKLEDPRGYTIEAMAEDVEAVRRHLALGKIDLLGHSYGGALAQAYALAHQQELDHLILCSTWHSTKKMNEVFRTMREKMPPELRARITKMESAGLFGHGKAYEQNRYTSEYMAASWGEGYFPYLYQNRPDPNYDPVASGAMSWDLYRDVGIARGIRDRRESLIGRVRCVPAEHQGPDTDHRGRQRRMRPFALPRNARAYRRLQAGDLPAERAHDIRGSAWDVHQGRGGVPRHAPIGAKVGRPCAIRGWGH